jgi:hypothetical protein
MTLTLRDALRSIFGAWLLANFNPAGLDLLDRTRAGALRSFFAALLVLPAHALLVIIQHWGEWGGPALAVWIPVEMISYVVRWTVFPVAMIRLSVLLGRGERYPGLVCAYNWSSAMQSLLYVPALLFAYADILPDNLAEGLVFGVIMAMITYQWFVTRVALAIGPLPAAALVFVDLFLSSVTSDIADAIMRGG